MPDFRALIRAGVGATAAPTDYQPNGMPDFRELIRSGVGAAPDPVTQAYAAAGLNPFGQGISATRPTQGIAENFVRGLEHGAYQGLSPGEREGAQSIGLFQPGERGADPGSGVGGAVGRTIGSMAAGIANPENIPANVLTAMGAGAVVKAAGPVLESIAQAAGPKVAQVIEHQLGGAVGGGAASGLQAVSQIPLSQWASDPWESVLAVTKAIGEGAAVGGAAGTVTGALAKPETVPGAKPAIEDPIKQQQPTSQQPAAVAPQATPAAPGPQAAEQALPAAPGQDLAANGNVGGGGNSLAQVAQGPAGVAPAQPTAPQVQAVPSQVQPTTPQVAPTDYAAMKAVELRDLAKSRGLASSGLKSELVKRLTDADTAATAQTAAGAQAANPAASKEAPNVDVQQPDVQNAPEQRSPDQGRQEAPQPGQGDQGQSAPSEPGTQGPQEPGRGGAEGGPGVLRQGGADGQGPSDGAVLKEPGKPSEVKGTEAPTAKAGAALRPEEQSAVSQIADTIQDDIASGRQLGAVAPSARMALLDPNVRDWLGVKAAQLIGRIRGYSLPGLVHADPAAGEAGITLASTKEYNRAQAQSIAQQVLGDNLRDADFRQKFGAVLTEDGLRATRDAFTAAGDTASAQNVQTLVGPDSYFKTQAEYQAALKDPEIQAAIARDKAIGAPLREAYYRRAQEIDPKQALTGPVGKDTGIHISLKRLDPDEAPGKSTVYPQGQGMIRKPSPFSRQRTGTAEAYDTDYLNMLENSLVRNGAIADLKDFQDKLVAGGNAELARPGARPDTIKGENAVGFQVKNGTLVKVDESGDVSKASLANGIYVRESLAHEVRAAAGDLPKGGIAALRAIADRSTALQLTFGLADQASHIANLTRGLMRSDVLGKTGFEKVAASFGGAPKLLVALKNVGDNAIKYAKDDAGTLAKYTKLAKAAATRAPHTDVPGQGPGATKVAKAVLGALGKPIEIYDRAARLTLADAHAEMVKAGLATDTPQSLREFVNDKAQQYNRLLQGDFVRFFRDSGMGPFATAGVGFTRMSIKNLTPLPSVQTPNAAAFAKLTALRAFGVAGMFAQSCLINAAISKSKGLPVQPMGRPGTPLGAIDTFTDDDAGRPRYWDYPDKLYGVRRGLRAVGLNDAVNSMAIGRTPSVDRGITEAVNEWTRPFVGPATNAALVAATGHNAQIKNTRGELQRVAPVVPPGQSQAAANVKSALPQLFSQLAVQPTGSQTPVAKALGVKPGSAADTALDIAAQQIRPFSTQVGQTPEKQQNAQKAMTQSQLKDYADDVATRARQRWPNPSPVRDIWVEDQIKAAAEEDQPWLRRELYKHKLIRAK